MTWLIEDLQGTKDGSNVDFTISYVPVANSLLVIFRGMQLERVGSQPNLLNYAYAMSGTAIELGIAPQSGQHAWVRYWFNP